MMGEIGDTTVPEEGLLPNFGLLRGLDLGDPKIYLFPGSLNCSLWVGAYCWRVCELPSKTYLLFVTESPVLFGMPVCSAERLYFPASFIDVLQQPRRSKQKPGVPLQETTSREPIPSMT